MNDTLKRARCFRTAMIVTGVVMIVAPVLGLATTLRGIMHAFDKLQPIGVSDPEIVSANIGEVLIGAAVGGGIAMLALPFFVVFSVGMYREKRKLEKMLSGKSMESPAQPLSWQDESPE